MLQEYLRDGDQTGGFMYPRLGQLQCVNDLFFHSDVCSCDHFGCGRNFTACIRILLVPILYAKHEPLSLDWILNLVSPIFDSGVDRFKRQFAHLDEHSGKGGKSSHILRHHISLPRYVYDKDMILPLQLLIRGIK